MYEARTSRTAKVKKNCGKLWLISPSALHLFQRFVARPGAEAGAKAEPGLCPKSSCFTSWWVRRTPNREIPSRDAPASHSDFIAWVSCRCLPFYNIITCVVCAWTIFRRYLRLFGSYWKIASCRWAAATTMDRIHIGGSKLFPRGGWWWDGFWGTLNSSFSFSSSSSWRSSWSLSWSLGKYLADSYLSCVSSLNKLFAFYEFVSMWWCSIRGPAKWVFEAIQAAVADTASLYRRNYLPTKKAKMSAISQSQQKAHICGLYLCGHRPGTCFLFRSH